MTLNIRSTIQVYCSGAFHVPMEISHTGPITAAQAKAEVTSRGWKFRGDNFYCPRHPPEKAKK